jgi:hypothetical protein
MQEVEAQKIRLSQKKNRLMAEETRLRLKERKMRTRHLIEVGGLVVKAGLDHLAVNCLYGALLTLKTQYADNEAIKDQWTKIGRIAFDAEQKDRIGVILKFKQETEAGVREAIRAAGLKWNRLRQEWYGFVSDIEGLKEGLVGIEHELEIIEN